MLYDTMQAICRVLELLVGSAYYVSSKRDETELLAATEAAQLRFPIYGYRKLSKELQQREFAAGEQGALRTVASVGNEPFGWASACPDDRLPSLLPALS